MNNLVRTLFVSGNLIYAGGEFTTVGGQTRNRLAAIDLTTGLATSFNPNMNSVVHDLFLSGSTLFVGGAFTTIGGVTRNRLAGISVATGQPTAWNPNVNNLVRTMQLAGSVLYIGGNFTSAGGLARARIAAFDTSSNVPNEWNHSASALVYAIAVSGNTVYVGGTFTTVDGQTRNRIAAIDASPASIGPLPWNPGLNDEIYVFHLHNECSNEKLYAGGIHTSVANIGQRGILQVSGVNQVVVSPAVTPVSCHELGDGTITISITGGAAPFQFSLDNTTFQQNNTFNQLAAGTITVYVKDSEACIRSFPVTITEPTPIFPGETVFNETCQGQANGGINLLPSGGVPPYTYSWSNGVTTPNNLGLSAGTYTVVIRDNTNCEKTQSYTIVADPLPVAVFAVNPTGGTVVLQNQSTGEPTEWLWDFGDGNTSVVQNPSHTYTTAGTYTICLTVTNACGTDISCDNVTVVGINDQVWSNGIRVFPNPASDHLRVEVAGNGSIESLVYSLTDITGRTIRSVRQANSGGFVVNMSDLDGGIYFLNLHQGDRTASIKVVKQ